MTEARSPGDARRERDAADEEAGSRKSLVTGLALGLAAGLLLGALGVKLWIPATQSPAARPLADPPVAEGAADRAPGAGDAPGAPGAGRAAPDGPPAPARPGPAPRGRPESSPEAGKWRAARASGLPAGRDGSNREGDGGEGWEPAPGDEALLTVPYLQGYRPAEGGERSVTLHRPEAEGGVNLYTSGHDSEAVLMTMEGRVLHRWRYPLRRLRPELYDGGDGEAQIRRLEYFRRARLLPDGDLLAIFEGLGLVRLAPDSTLRWAYRGGAHHDLDLDSRGRIWVLDREGRTLPRIRRDGPILEDRVTVLSPEGEVLRQISILEALERSPYAPLLERRPPRPDILHTNTLEILDGRLAGRNPAFRAGNVLLSILELDTVAVLDPEREEIVWALTGMWRKQHQPTVVAGSGRSGPALLMFDNLGGGAGRPAPEASRILELDPLTLEVRWSYGGSGEDFFSRTLGSVQRLPGGNTLITESENGRAFEVTPAGETVWEFLTPHRAGDRGELVAVLFEVERLPWSALPAGFPFQNPPERAGGRRSGR